MNFMMRAAISCAIVLPGIAGASSEDAWAEFRESVEVACRAQIQAPDRAVVEIEVNPFGSERFGAAIIDVFFEGGDAERSLCIYEKRTGLAELTAPFAAPADSLPR